MAKRYWRSQKSKDFLNARKADLEFLFTFLNANIQAMGFEEFVELLNGYTSFMLEDGSSGVFQEYMKEYQRYSGDLGPQTPPEVLHDRKVFFAELQDHLRLHIESIKKTLKSGKTEPFLIVGNPLTIFIQPSEDRFIESFGHRDTAGDLDFEEEKRKLSIKLMQLITDLDLRPSRFRKCPKCQKFFYQPTAREKSYCSQRCAATVRQERYERRKHRR